MSDERPKLTLAEMFHAAVTVAKGNTVSLEIFEERTAICAECPYRKIDKKGVPFCGICGCTVGRDMHKLFNLALYAEKLPKHGCKHPFRGFSKKFGWRR